MTGVGCRVLGLRGKVFSGTPVAAYRHFTSKMEREVPLEIDNHIEIDTEDHIIPINKLIDKPVDNSSLGIG